MASLASGFGLVTLVGAGPGDPQLMTLAGARALAAAEVVLFDRLAPRELLREWAPRAELIDVGKRPGHHAVPQEQINALLIEHATAGRNTVRLKGGDPFVFGRGAEELAACHAHGIETRVIPGVSSAIAVPAAAGIPVTRRDVSRSFTVLSGHAPLSDDELKGLVLIGGTIVVLMGVMGLPQLSAGLVRHGMPGQVPLAIVERGFGADMRVTRTSVGAVTSMLAALAPRSPAVIVIGEVAASSASELDAVLAGAVPADMEG